jgi:hypothetical protein
VSTRAGVRHRLAQMSPWTGPASRPLQEFLRTEAGGAVLLLAATLVALVWANSPLSGAYEDLWGTRLTVSLGGEEISEDLRHWVNDGLMVFFFYVVGLEIRREFAMGELADKRQAAVPAVAALAGMVVPALVYLAFNLGTEAARGWGIVMATDIAFVLGALALLGPACPGQLRVFLLTLAIVDDIGAITVIAIFYSSSVDVPGAGGRGGHPARDRAAASRPRLARAGVLRGGARAVGGDVKSGVHPTIAGCLGRCSPRSPRPARAVERAARATRSSARRRPRGPALGPSSGGACPPTSACRSMHPGRATWSSRCSRWPTRRRALRERVARAVAPSDHGARGSAESSWGSRALPARRPPRASGGCRAASAPGSSSAAPPGRDRLHRRAVHHGQRLR